MAVANDTTKKFSSKTSNSNSCERTFITFSEDLIFKKLFRKNKKKPVEKNICPITR